MVFAALVLWSFWISWDRYVRFVGVLDPRDWIGLAVTLLPTLVLVWDIREHRKQLRFGDWIQPVTLARFARWCVIAFWIPAMMLILPKIEKRRAVAEFEASFGAINKCDLPQMNWPFWWPFPRKERDFKVEDATWSVKRFGLENSSRLPVLLTRMRSPLLVVEEWPHRDLGGLPSFPEIQHLALAAPRHLESLAGIERYAGLQGFSIGQAEKLRTLSGIDRLRNLREFAVNSSPIGDLKPVGTLENLTKLSIGSLAAEANLDPLRSCKNLEVLDVIWQWQQGTLDGLGGLTNLRHLRLHGLPELKRLPSLNGLNRLEHLRIFICKNLETLDGVESCRALLRIRLDDCEGLQDIRALAAVPALEVMEIERCKGITRAQREAIGRAHALSYQGMSGNTAVWKKPSVQH